MNRDKFKWGVFLQISLGALLLGLFIGGVAFPQTSFFQGKTAETVKILDDLMDRAPMMSRRTRQQIAGLFGICAYFGSLPLDEAFAALDRVYILQGDSPTGEAQDLQIGRAHV